MCKEFLEYTNVTFTFALFLTEKRTRRVLPHLTWAITFSRGLNMREKVLRESSNMKKQEAKSFFF